VGESQERFARAFWRAESDREVSISADATKAIQAALEAAGAEFISENGGGPGVRLKSATVR
jgi:hypothetical protein